jgi:hypothetical protein
MTPALNLLMTVPPPRFLTQAVILNGAVPPKARFALDWRISR